MPTTQRQAGSRDRGHPPLRSPAFSITEEEFDLFRQLIHKSTGICLADHKRELVVSRLARRLRSLELKNFKDYYRFLTEDPAGEEEMGQMINRITTNKTEFYRENHHFIYLRDELLPKLFEEKERAGRRVLRAWSSASSTGEEPYTIAITLAEFFANRPGWDFKLLATDLDTEVLTHASHGVYSADRVDPVPGGLLGKYFTKTSNHGQVSYQVKPELRRLVTFRHFNLLTPNYPFKVGLDFIFCRNVMIYFNMEDKIALMEKFHRILNPKGYVFVGHSESLMMVKHLFRYIKNTIYQKI